MFDNSIYHARSYRLEYCNFFQKQNHPPRNSQMWRGHENRKTDFPPDGSLLYHYRGSGNGSGASDVGEVPKKLLNIGTASSVIPNKIAVVIIFTNMVFADNRFLIYYFAEFAR